MKGWRIFALAVSLASVAFGLYFLRIWALSSSGDAILLAPLFFLGLPLTFVGNVIDVCCLGIWEHPVAMVTCYFLQWQIVALWIYHKAFEIA
jgi:hypothetical protein